MAKKTTVAEIIGKVFASWGILSGGRVIRTEKSQMVGQWVHQGISSTTLSHYLPVPKHALRARPAAQKIE